MGDFRRNRSQRDRPDSLKRKLGALALGGEHTRRTPETGRSPDARRGYEAIPSAGSPLQGIPCALRWSSNQVRYATFPPQDIFDSCAGITLESFAYRSERADQSIESACVDWLVWGTRNENRRWNRLQMACGAVRPQGLREPRRACAVRRSRKAVAIMRPVRLFRLVAARSGVRLQR